MKGTGVTMFGYNNYDNDTSVLKETGPIVRAGYLIKIFVIHRMEIFNKTFQTHNICLF